MPTIKDIANRLGISPSTVSKGLHGAGDISDSMRDLVLKTAVEMGYRPKRMLQREHRKVCILVENMDFEHIDQFGYGVIAGFEHSAFLQDYQVTVTHRNLKSESQADYDTYMLENGFSGAFLLGFELHDNYLKQLGHTKIPTVLLDNYVAGNSQVGYIGTDNYEGMEQLIAHLQKSGHSRIAFFNGTKNSRVTGERLHSFEEAMAAHQLPVNNERIVFGDYNTNCAAALLPQLLEADATAIVCASDYIASCVMQELHERGIRVPEDISVAGYDDLPLASQLTPALTTIRQDRNSLGKSAFFLLDALMQEIPIHKIELRSRLIIRKSTGRINQPDA